MSDPRITPTLLAEAAFNGITSIIYVFAVLFIGCLLIAKYIRYKDKKLLIIGLNIILLPAAYIASSVVYILALGEIYTEDIIYSFAMQAPRLLNLFLWVYIFSELHYKEKQKQIMIFVIVYLVIWEAIYLLLSTLDLSLFISEREGLIEQTYRLPMSLLVGSQLVIFIITFSIFVKITLKSINPEIRLRGKLTLIFLLCYTIGTLMASFIPIAFISLPAKLILILGAIFLYLAFSMPQGLKKRLIKPQSISSS